MTAPSNTILFATFDLNCLTGSIGRMSRVAAPFNTVLFPIELYCLDLSSDLSFQTGSSEGDVPRDGSVCRIYSIDQI